MSVEFREGMKVKVAHPDPNGGGCADKYVGMFGVIVKPWRKNRHGYEWSVDLDEEGMEGIPFASVELAPVNVKVIEGEVFAYGDDYYIRDTYGEEHCITQMLDEHVGSPVRLTWEELDG